MEVKIEKIILKLGKQTVSLTVEEAEELRKALNDLMAKYTQPDIIRIEHPIWYTPHITPYYPMWTVSYTGDTSTLSLKNEPA